MRGMTGNDRSGKEVHRPPGLPEAAGENGEFYGMVFQDSDVAKWLEAAAYSLALTPDPALEERVDEVVALIGRCQQPAGYLNTYFTVKEPLNRWANLQECHKLYSVGHMLEAGVALHDAAGKDALLRICIRLADRICEIFMQEEGIPSRQEIEIGLLRLRHAIGNARYRDMAPRLLDQRGQNPGWFLRHTPKRPGGALRRRCHSDGGHDLQPVGCAGAGADRGPAAGGRCGMAESAACARACQCCITSWQKARLRLIFRRFRAFCIPVRVAVTDTFTLCAGLDMPCLFGAKREPQALLLSLPAGAE